MLNSPVFLSRQRGLLSEGISPPPFPSYVDYCFGTVDSCLQLEDGGSFWWTWGYPYRIDQK